MPASWKLHDLTDISIYAYIRRRCGVDNVWKYAYVIYGWPQQFNRTGNIFLLEIWQLPLLRAVIFFLDVIKTAYMQLSASFGSISLHMLQYLINILVQYYFQDQYLLKLFFIIWWWHFHEFTSLRFFLQNCYNYFCYAY